MKTVKIRKDIDYEKTILICIFWTARKTKTFEGCAPFFITKIITPDNIHVPEGRKRLKLTSGIVSKIWEDSDYFKPSEIEIMVGNEILNVYFGNETFSVSAIRNKELETEITEKLEGEFNKKYPRMCQEFISRVLDK